MSYLLAFEQEKICNRSDAKQRIDMIFSRMGGRYRKEEIDKFYESTIDQGTAEDN
jgi:hypothetical protein